MFKKDEIQLKAFSYGGFSTASLDKLASAKYAEDVLSYADLGEISVVEKENLFQENFVDIFPLIGLTKIELGPNVIGLLKSGTKKVFPTVPTLAITKSPTLRLLFLRDVKRSNYQHSTGNYTQVTSRCRIQSVVIDSSSRKTTQRNSQLLPSCLTQKSTQ